jgi:acyl-coenzyme A synthetase/AMP-(fatty) acid ligase
MVKPGPEMLIAAFALIKVGAVPVLVDPGIGRSNLSQCLAEAKPKAFIGIPLAQVARRLLGWAKETVEISITVGRPKIGGGFTYREIMRKGRNSCSPSDVVSFDDPAAIVFTSGSTGPPKGVVYTNRMFSAQARLLQESVEIEAGEVDLATFPLFALFDPALQVTTVFPKMDFTRPGLVNPQEIIAPIHRYRITHMFGSPALLDRVGRYGERHGIKLPSLRRVLSAGAPVSDRIMRRFLGMLNSHTRLFTPYGATEALPVCAISHEEVFSLGGTAEGKGVCVGRPLNGVNVRIIKTSDEAIEQWSNELEETPGEVGELVVWGDNVSQAYFERSEANRLGKIESSAGQIRHRMGDLGYFDKDGRIWFCGRKSQRVTSSSGTLLTVPCEGVFNQHSKVKRSALVGLGRSPNQQPVLCVETEGRLSRKQKAELKKELLDLGKRFSHTKSIEHVLFHPGFPVDIRHNAKIFREKLAIWAGKQR